MVKMNKVYELLTQIPYEKVTTYKALAIKLGDKNLARAVGNALHNNKDGNKYPCYKVVNSKGELSLAYAFGGIRVQEERLKSEGIEVVDNKVNLDFYGFL